MNNQMEQDKVFKYILNNSILKYFRELNDEEINNKTYLKELELIITPECNLNCSYCYLNKHKDELYPIELRNHQTILNNLSIFINFLHEKKLFVNVLSLFSGEIWASDFGVQFLTILLEKNKEQRFCKKIIIPSNMSFLLNDIFLNKIENIIKQLKEIDIELIWSASVDGKIIEDKFRPFNDPNKKHTEEFYTKLFLFAKKYPSTGFHPMISSKSCKYWIENYKWFEENFKTYFNKEIEPMMLEVRNPDWTLEDIEEYKKFLSFLIYNQKEKSTSLKDFAERIFRYGKHATYTYYPYSLSPAKPRTSCGLQTSLHLRLGDLAIVPCHRLSYNNLILGYFLVKDNRIYDIQAKNSELFLYLETLTPKMNHLKCDNCKYNSVCLKGCLGAQYEYTKQLNYPCENVCNLFKEKIDFLIDIYKKEGLLEQLEKDILEAPHLKKLLNALKEVEK